MSMLRRLGVGLLALLVILSTALFGVLPLSETATAAPTYTYETVDSEANPNLCPDARGEVLAIRETDTTGAGGSTITSYWCHVSSTTYEFAKTQGNNRISVAAASPQQGTLTSATQTSTIGIGNAALFSQTFQNAVTESPEGSSCESVGGVLGWIMCPLISILSWAVNWLDSRVHELLEIGSDRYTNPQLKQAWMNLRNIAYIILIPIMLVMVIGTALGFDIFNAYTVKKALPRMVIAIIFITLSWHITTFLVGFFNVLGGGVLGLMTSPFGMDHNLSLASLFGASKDNAGDVVSSTVSGGVQWASTLGPLVGLAVLVSPIGGGIGGLPILMLTLLLIVLQVLVAFLVLMAREIFILIAILLAPLAILAWIFPGNDKLWKAWWSMFSKLLIMFPLIMALIAGGRIVAHMINISGGGGLQSFVNPLLKLLAYALPYMLIPMTFKYAGGLFANLVGVINDKDKGLFDRIRKSRGEHFAGLRKRGGNNSLYDQVAAEKATGLKGRYMRRVNSVGGWIFDPISNAQVALGTEKGKVIMSHVWQGKAEDSQKLAEVLGKMGFNAEELSAIALGRTIKVKKIVNGKEVIEDEKIAAWNGTGHDLERLADDLARSEDAQDRIGANHLRANSAFLTHINRSEEYGRANIKAAAGLAYAAQGFATPDQIAQLTSELSQNGSGLGSMFKTNAELLSARAGGLGKPGYGVRYGEYTDENGNIQIGYYAPKGIDGAKIEQVVRSGVQDISTAKGSQLTKQLHEAMRHIMTASADTTWTNASGGTQTIGEIRGGVEETLIQVLGSYAAPDVKRRVSDILIESRTITYAGQGMSKVDAAATAQQEVQALMRRGSGNLNMNELNAAEQAQQNEDKK